MTINLTVVVTGCTSSSGKFFTSFTDLTSHGVHPRTKEWQMLLKQIQKTHIYLRSKVPLKMQKVVKYLHSELFLILECFELIVNIFHLKVLLLTVKVKEFKDSPFSYSDSPGDVMVVKSSVDWSLAPAIGSWTSFTVHALRVLAPI